MARLQSKRWLGIRRVYDVQTSTGNFFARSAESPGTTGLLVHNSHQLSPNALDALLKYLEDTFPGSDDKKLTCIFCTTEPEKMRATILSRCAPAFVVQPQKSDIIAKRLMDLCEKEGLEAEYDMLVLIAEVTECHIRDAMKAVEGVSMLGTINKANVSAYLHIDLNTVYLDLLQAIGTDLRAALEASKTIMQRVSPATAYGKLAEVSMLAYQRHLGDTISGPWSVPALQALGEKGALLLGYASRFASRPGRPTAAMLLMDIASLHHVGGSVRSPGVVLQVQVAAAAPAVAPQVQSLPASSLTPASPAPSPVVEIDPSGGTVLERDRDWMPDPRLVNRRGQAAPPLDGNTRSPYLNSAEFAHYLGKHLAEGSGSGRPTG